MNAAKDIIDDAVLERPVVWFEVFAVSGEFMELARDIPELMRASSIEHGGRRVEGPRNVFVANSLEKLEERLPNIARQIVASGATNVVVVRKATRCSQCSRDRAEHPERPAARCPHGRATLNRAFAVDISKYPA